MAGAKQSHAKTPSRPGAKETNMTFIRTLLRRPAAPVAAPDVTIEKGRAVVFGSMLYGLWS